MTSHDGLSSAEAAARLRRHGPNVVQSQRRTTAARRVLNQLHDPLMVVLVFAAALTLATGDYPDAVIITLVIVVNTGVGVTQELRADNAITALAAMAAPLARVVRDGAEREIAAADVVPGDLVVLAEGDVVPADGEIVEAAALLVDESALTGESVPVDKAARHEDEPGDDVAAGTVVVRGRGVVAVTATGADSAMGRIAVLLGAPPGLTPLQRRLVGLGRLLAVLAAVLCLVVLAVGLVRGHPLELMVVTAISLVVAAVPESLPAVVTLSLALGARRMATRNAIMRRLPAVETLGSVTVVATDKTGTVTEGRMVAEWLWTPFGDASVTGVGYAPVGTVVDDNGLVTERSAPHLVELLRAAVLCNDATLRPPDGGGPEWSITGDPTEAALLAAAGKIGLGRATLDTLLPRTTEVPFDSARKRMTTVHRVGEADALVVTKGAPEVLLGSHHLRDGPERIAGAAARAEAFAEDGYRVLALASTRRTRVPDDVEELERGLSLLGLIAIADPPRPSAATTIAACREAGITPVLITGDHVATARSVAARLGILDHGGVTATGRQLRAGQVPDPTQVHVFARTTPEQKLDIVRAWQRAGQVVAMTGDGVNDGPALRQADIGVAMGRRGTEVARQAADLVLADDDLATVVTAVEEGRRIYDNVRRFLLYGMSGGAAEILVMLIGPAVGMSLPLLPAQILWVNLMTHGLPGVALGAEPADVDVMRRPPRPPDESVIGDGLWQRVIRLSAVIAAVTLGVGIWAHATGRPWQTMVFFALAATQLGVAFGVRARPGTWENPFLLIAAGAAFALQLAAVYLPPLQDLLGTEPLTVAEIGAVCLVSVAGYLAARLDRGHSP